MNCTKCFNKTKNCFQAPNGLCYPEEVRSKIMSKIIVQLNKKKEV